MMYQKTLLLVILFSFGFGVFQAQSQDEFVNDSLRVRKKYTYEIPKYRLGVSYTSFFQFRPSFQLSHDFRMNDFTEFSVETGILLSARNRFQGFRIRPSIEMYLIRDRIVGIFIGASLNSLNTWELYEITLQFENAYFKEIREVRKRNLIGGYLVGGFKMKLGKHVFWETSLGLGRSFLHNSEMDLPNIGGNSFWSEENGWSAMGSVYLNGNLSIPLVFE